MSNNFDFSIKISIISTFITFVDSVPYKFLKTKTFTHHRQSYQLIISITKPFPLLHGFKFVSISVDTIQGHIQKSISKRNDKSLADSMFLS